MFYVLRLVSIFAITLAFAAPPTLGSAEPVASERATLAVAFVARSPELNWDTLDPVALTDRESHINAMSTEIDQGEIHLLIEDEFLREYEISKGYLGYNDNMHGLRLWSEAVSSHLDIIVLRPDVAELTFSGPAPTPAQFLAALLLSEPTLLDEKFQFLDGRYLPGEYTPSYMADSAVDHGVAVFRVRNDNEVQWHAYVNRAGVAFFVNLNSEIFTHLVTTALTLEPREGSTFHEEVLTARATGVKALEALARRLTVRPQP